MIKELRLENYRGFANHRIPFGDLTILLGRNNAGKSTAVEALRLLSTVVRRFRASSPFVEIPSWLDDDRAFRGIQPAVPDLDFDERSFFYGYGGGPAAATALFANGTSVNAFIGPLGEIHGVARGRDGQPAANASQAKALGLPDLRVQPQLGPLLRKETVLMRATVMSRLGVSPSIHFRNQLFLFPNDFEEFKRFAEETWPEVQIREFAAWDASYGDELRLIVRDGEFAADVGLMGHGLQMWLQTIWFLSRAPRDACVVLDEPDVYMHPDMQHRLLMKLDGRYQQVVIATHSVEIISSTDPRSLVVVDRSRKRSRALMSVDAAQAAIEDLGGVHNLHVTRLFRSERFLMIEGDDAPLLGALQQLALEDTRVPITTLPAYETGGWGGWHHAVRSRLPRRNGEGKPIATYCFFDSDYHTSEEIAQRYVEADQHKVNLHVWERKELENYVLIPAAIKRLIKDRASKRRTVLTEEVESKLAELAQALLDDTVDSLADELHRRDRGLGVRGARRKAKQRIDAKVAKIGLPAVVSGKALIGGLSRWAGEQFGVSFSALTLARYMKPVELAAEIREVLEALERKTSFPSHLRER